MWRTAQPTQLIRPDFGRIQNQVDRIKQRSPTRPLPHLQSRTKPPGLMDRGQPLKPTATTTPWQPSTTLQQNINLVNSWKGTAKSVREISPENIKNAEAIVLLEAQQAEGAARECDAVGSSTSSQETSLD